MVGGVSLPSAWVHPVRPCRRGRRRSQGTAHATGCPPAHRTSMRHVPARSCWPGLRCGKSHAVPMEYACKQGLMNLITGAPAPPPTHRTSMRHVPAHSCWPGLRCGKSHAVPMEYACKRGLMNLIPGVPAPPPAHHTPTGHVPVVPGAFRSQIVRGNRTSERQALCPGGPTASHRGTDQCACGHVPPGITYPHI